MAILLRCPACETSLRVAAAPTAGQKVKCPKCGNAFAPEPVANPAPAPAAVAPPPPEPEPLPLPDEDEPPAPAPKSRPTAKSRRDVDDEPAPKPVAKSRRAEEDANDRPRPTSRKRRDPEDDEDDDPRPRRSRNARKPEKGNGLLVGLVVAGGFVGILALGGLVWAFTGKKPDTDTTSNPPTATDRPSPAPNNTTPNTTTNTNATPNTTTNPAPGDTPASKDLLEKSKRATARITVDFGNKYASGSGFLVRANPDAAYVVTNYHVIDARDDEPEPKADPGFPGFPGRPPGFPGRPPGFPARPPGFPARPPGFGPPGFGPPGFGGPAAQPKAKTKVYVVLHSGTPEEQTHAAEVVAIDPEADLATLKITGARNVPEPLDVTQEAPVRETMPVYILGFPGGAKNLSMGEGKVSQLRRDANNVLNDVQINGLLIPGNSGGPVVDGQGRLIGIAVSTVKDKNVGWAIPAAQLNHMLKGSVLLGLVCKPRSQGPQVHATGEIWLLDRKSSVQGRDVFQGQIGTSNQPIIVESNEFRVIAVLNDPMHKVNAVKALYAKAENLPAKPDAKGWAPLAGATTVAMQVQDDLAKGDFKLPVGSYIDDTYAFQFSYVNADGQTVYTQPHPLRLTFPKNPKSVRLHVTTPLDDPSRRYVTELIGKTFTGMKMFSYTTPQGINAEIDEVDDPKAIADKIKFGEVIAVEGRTITVAVKTVDLPAPTAAELDQALADLKSTKVNERRGGADRLGKVYVIVADRREEVAKALEAAAQDKDHFLRQNALRALTLWAGPENTPGLITLLDSADHFGKESICRILGKSKDPKAAAAVAKLLPNLGERGMASAALKAMGSAAEKAVIEYITHKDGFTAAEACNILKEIGGKDSITALEDLLKGKVDFFVSNAAKGALKTIEERKRTEKK